MDPDIFVVVTDDHPALDFSTSATPKLIGQMPWVTTNMLGAGVKFTRFRAAQPRCAPNRASLLTGKYPHKHGVLDNDYAGVGNSFNPNETIAVALRNHGYRTHLIGKYMNLWGERRDDPDHNRVPPGWDSWYAYGAPGPDYLHFKTRYANPGHDGSTLEDTTHWDATANPANYSTCVFRDKAVAAIGATPADVPIFMWLGLNAPHGGGGAPGVPEAQYAGSACPAGTWQPENFNEANATKPEYIRTHPLYDGFEDMTNHCRVLRSVDDLLAAVWNELVDRGRSGNALIIFTADNGNAFGEHRLDDKGMPYLSGTHVHMLAYGPGITMGVPRTVDDLRGAQGLAPTLAELAGTTLGYAHQGIPFTSSITGTGPVTLQNVHLFQQVVPRGDEVIPSFTGIETQVEISDLALERYWEHTHVDTSDPGHKEFYELGPDPWEMSNHNGDAGHAARQAVLQAQLEAERGDLADRPYFSYEVGRAAQNAAGLTLTIPVDEAVAAGHTNQITSFATGATGVTGIDTKGNTYALDWPAPSGTFGIYFLSGRVTTALTPSDEITLTFTGTTVTDRRAVALAYKNLKVSNPFRSGTAATSASSDKPVTDPVTAGANGLIVSAVSYANAGGEVTEGAGQIQRFNHYSSGRAVFVQEALILDPAAYTGRAVLANPALWVAAQATYDMEPSAAGGTGVHATWTTESDALGVAVEIQAGVQTGVPEPPDLPEPASLTSIRLAIQEELEEDLAPMKFVGGLLEGPIENRDLGSVLVARGGENEDVNTGNLAITVRAFKRWTDRVPEAATDPTRLEELAEQIEAALADRQTDGVGMTRIHPSVWFMRVVDWEVDVDSQGVEVTLTAWRDNPST